MATIITVPHLTSDGGISPKRLRTFSERNSISISFFIFTLIILKLHFHYLCVHNQAFWMFFAIIKAIYDFQSCILVETAALIRLIESIVWC